MKDKQVLVDPMYHKILRKRAFDNNSTIKRELEKVIEKDLDEGELDD